MVTPKSANLSRVVKFIVSPSCQPLLARQSPRLWRHAGSSAQLDSHVFELFSERFIAQQGRRNRRPGNLPGIDIAAEMGARNETAVAVILDSLLNVPLLFRKDFGKHEADRGTVGGVSGRI